MVRIAIPIALLLVSVSPTPSRAFFHTALISEVMSGVNGDPSVQYVEIRVTAAPANAVKDSVLTAFSCTGMSHSVLLTVPGNVSNGILDAHWIMATTTFAVAAGIMPDFTWDPAVSGNIDPICGMVCWGAPGAVPPAPGTWSTTDPSNYVDCVGYGGYSGATKPTSGFPTGNPPGDGTQSLTRLTSTQSNLADFQLASPTPTNNAGFIGVFPVVTTTTVMATTSTSATSTSSSTTTAPSDTTTTDTASTSTTATTVADTSTTTTTVTTTTESSTSTSSSTTTTAPPVTTRSTTTTTTTLPAETACSPSVVCDDGDACSVDHCVAGTGCVHDPVTAAADLDRIGPACTGQPVPLSVGQQFARACGLIESASSQTPKKAKALLTKAARALGRAAKVAAKAGTRKKAPISTDCATALRSAVGGARDQALRKKSGL